MNDLFKTFTGDVSMGLYMGYFYLLFLIEFIIFSTFILHFKSHVTSFDKCQLALQQSKFSLANFQFHLVFTMLQAEKFAYQAQVTCFFRISTV